MARGVRLLFGADIGLATSGVAGPETQEEKAVGTLCLGISTANGEDKSTTERLSVEGRQQIRTESVERAIIYLLTTLLE
jgi:nicotinamide mononucleotide (NMN) deamidase PncC